jgi:hypothetical protein
MSGTQSVEVGKLRDFRRAGVNRLSIGVQSLNADDLKYLGRAHSPEVLEQLKRVVLRVASCARVVRCGQSRRHADHALPLQEALRAIELGKEIFPRVSFDLIYARHRNQTVEEWRKELQVRDIICYLFIYSFYLLNKIDTIYCFIYSYSYLLARRQLWRWPADTFRCTR